METQTQNPQQQNEAKQTGPNLKTEKQEAQHKNQARAKKTFPWTELEKRPRRRCLGTSTSPWQSSPLMPKQHWERTPPGSRLSCGPIGSRATATAFTAPSHFKCPKENNITRS
jgi:hypothetical protein